MSATTPVYGIHYPTRATKMVNLGSELEAFASDIEAKLLAANIPPVTAAPVMVAATAAARDAYWGVPGSEAARITLQNRGATTVRTDVGWTERYYATYNATTNPGGASPAGWYPVSGEGPELVARGFNSLQVAGSGSSWATLPVAGSTVVQRDPGFTLAGTALTVPMPGIYEVKALVSFGGSTTGPLRGFRARPSSGGSSQWQTIYRHTPTAASGIALPLVATLPLGAADQLVFDAIHDSSTPQNVNLLNLDVKWRKPLRA